MGHVDHHAELVHLAYDLFAVTRETAVHRFGDFVGPRRIRPVGVEGVGQRHVADAEPIEGAQGR